MKKLLALLCAALLLCPATLAGADVGGTRKINYDWQPVTIGGGGLMVGYVFHPTIQGLAYTRGDVGGLWKRGPEDNGRWQNLSNHFSRAQYWYYGCDGVAVDPNNPDVIYYCAGKYTWSGVAQIFKSTDGGKTWNTTGYNKNAFGSNEGVRRCGEIIMIDPANSNIIYVGGNNGHGLYRSLDAAQTWQHVDGVEISSANNALRCIEFDPTSVSGGKTQRIYVGVLNQGLYKTEDAGETWEQVSADVKPGRMQITDDGTLFCSSGTGVYRYKDNTFENISPVEGAGYVDIAVDPKDPNFMVCMYAGGNIMRYPIMLSTDGGKNWKNVEQDANIIQHTGYLEDDNFSSSPGFIAMDPFDRNHIVFGDWFGLWETKDVTASTVTWESDNLGIEEFCALSLISHPDSKYRLLAVGGDEDGFPILDLDNMQQRKFNDAYLTYGGKRFMTTQGIDICASDANFVVRVGTDHFGGEVSSYSEDGGTTWKSFGFDPVAANNTEKGYEHGGCRVKFSSNLNPQTGKPNTIVVIQSGVDPVVSNDMGETWTVAKGLPAIYLNYQECRMTLEKDYTQPDTFYFYDYTTFTMYRSTDGGYNWKMMRKFDELTDVNGREEIHSVPGSPGEVWFNSGSNTAKKTVGNLYRTTDGFETVSEVQGVSNIVSFTFGKNAPDRDNPAVYVYGTINGREGIYRSDDMGNNWDRIDEFETFGAGNNPNAMCGDMHDYGVVYICTDGSGILYGKPAGLVLEPMPEPEGYLKSRPAGAQIATEPPEENNKPAEPAKEEIPNEVSVDLTINGRKVENGGAFLENNTLYYQARALYEALGASVVWNDGEAAAMISRKEMDTVLTSTYASGTPVDKRLLIKPKSGEVWVNGVSAKLNQYPKLVAGKTYVPLEEFMKIWNISVTANENKTVVSLYDKAIVMD